VSPLTDRRPDTTRIYDLQTDFRTMLPDVVTPSQLFKRNGYVAARLGKIYRTAIPRHRHEWGWTIRRRGTRA